MTDPAALLATLQATIVSGRVTAGTDKRLNEALNDIEQLVGRLERMYIAHVAHAREAGRNRGIADAVDALRPDHPDAVAALLRRFS